MPRYAVERSRGGKATASVLVALAVVVWAVTYRAVGGQRLDWTLAIPVAVLAVAVFSVAVPGRRYGNRTMATGRVVAIIPAFNESPEALHDTIRSLLAGTRPPDEIHVVDDGSDVPIPPFDHPRVFWYRQRNAGKHKAQVFALLHVTEAAFILTVDSDCTVDRLAVERLLQAMSDEQVQAATGVPLTRNRRGWLTRVIDLEIASICLTYRAARSTLGSLTTCSGALALYRSAVILDNLDDYASGPKGHGDDRRLTHYAMLRGQVVSVSEAVVHTDMPTKIRQLYRQRVRWDTSHWYYALWEMANLPTRAVVWIGYHLILSVVVPASLVWTLLVAPLLGHEVAWEFLAYWTGVCWLLTFRYAVGRPHMKERERWLTWLLGVPVLVAVQLLVFRPAMVHALFKLRSTSWGTRSTLLNRGRYRVVSVAAGRYRYSV